MIGGRFFVAVVVFTVLGVSLAVLPRLTAIRPETARIDLAAFERALAETEKAWGDGEVEGMARIAPPPGSDLYLLASRYEWRPALRLTAGGTYRLHLTSEDVLHGLFAPTLSWRFEAAPGYERVVEVTAPPTAGSHVIVCDEFCGDGHHLMTARIEVVPSKP